MKNRLQKNGVARQRLGDGGIKTKQTIICLLLAAAIFAVYWQTLGHEFVHYDDRKYISQNENISGLTWENIVWAFTASRASHWHPVTWLSHMLDYQLYGLNPKGHHLTNVLFHIANAMLLFLVVQRMTGALWQSAFVAALFAIHPLNVESVAWAAERKNVLSAFFWLTAMWAYISYVEKKSVLRYGLVFLLLALGLMSKPMLVTLPFVFLMLDYWPLGRWKPGGKGEGISRLIIEKVPLMALAVGSSVITYLIQKSSGTIRSLEVVPLQARIVNALVSYLEYLGNMAWPKALAVLYPHPGSALPMWKGVVCGAAIIIISAVAVWMVRRAPYFAFGWFWYLGTLVPVIGLVQSGLQAMADRYTYIPLIGVFIAVAWGLPELLAKWPYRDKVLSGLAGILIPALMVIAWMQVGHWKNSLALFKHTVEATDKKYPTFAVAHIILGDALYKQKKMDEAIVHYKEAIRLDPDFRKAYVRLGDALYKQKKMDEIIVNYKKTIRGTIRLNPNLAIAHSNLGDALVEQKKIDEAIVHYKEAIRLDPDFTKAYVKLGVALSLAGKPKL